MKDSKKNADLGLRVAELQEEVEKLKAQQPVRAVLTPAEAAEYLQIPLENLLKLSRKRGIPCVSPKVFGLGSDDFRYFTPLLDEYMVNQSLKR